MDFNFLCEAPTIQVKIVVCALHQIRLSSSKKRLILITSEAPIHVEIIVVTRFLDLDESLFLLAGEFIQGRLTLFNNNNNNMGQQLSMTNNDRYYLYLQCMSINLSIYVVYSSMYSSIYLSINLSISI